MEGDGIEDGAIEAEGGEEVKKKSMWPAPETAEAGEDDAGVLVL